MIYDIGNKPLTCFVLREGAVKIETIIEIDRFYKYPVKLDEWEIRKERFKIEYQLLNVKKGMFFGLEEVLNGVEKRC